MFACVVAGAAAAAVCLPEPGGEAAGEPESEQEAGGHRGPGRGGGAGRGGRERPHAARRPDATNQRPGAVPEEDGRHRGLNVSNRNLFMVLHVQMNTFNSDGSAVNTVFL